VIEGHKAVKRCAFSGPVASQVVLGLVSIPSNTIKRSLTLAAGTVVICPRQ
jgi:hypothetical protein